MSRKFKVYGVGNAITDLQLQAKDKDLQKLDLRKGGMQLVEASDQEKLIEYFHGADINQASGGSAANTIIALQQLGAPSAFACLVGDDGFGKGYLKEMDELGVHVSTTPAAGKTSGTCVILITPDAERTMNTHLGVSAEISEDQISEEVIKDSDWIYIEGYLFTGESGQRAVKRSVELAKKHDTKIAITFSDSYIVNVFGEPLREAVASADLVFANFDEAKSFTGAEEEDQVFEALTKACPNAVMTMSEKGARVKFGSESFLSAPFPTTPVDATGAGDIFAGGFLFGVTTDSSPQKAAKLACFLGSKIVSQLGPRLDCDVKMLSEMKECLPSVGNL